MSTASTHTLRGVLMVLLAAVCWGTTGTAQSFAPPGSSAYWTGALRLLASSLFFAAALAASATAGTASAAAWRGLPWRGVVVAGAGMAVYNLAFFAGVRAAGVAVGTAVALGSGPIWAGLLQALGGQRPPWRWWCGTALAVTGGMAMVGGGDGGLRALSPLGIALCLTAGLSYAVYALANKQLVARSSPTLVTFAVFALATALAMPAAALIAGVPTLAARDLVVAAYLGIVATGIAYLLFSHALRHIAAATGVTLALAEPVVAFILAITIVGERPGLLTIAGGTLVLAGLLVVISAELRAPRR